MGSKTDIKVHATTTVTMHHKERAGTAEQISDSQTASGDESTIVYRRVDTNRH